MKEINYSFIIPHKNIPDLLQRCLDSIPRREDIQIIVVDDNSDLDKVDFDHFPGISEPCVEVYFTKEGRGTGYARNVGLKHAKGKWLLFADADDFFTNNIERILDQYIDSCFDIIYFWVDSVDSDTLLPSDRGTAINEMIKKAVEIKDYDAIKYRRLEPWAKIISHNLVTKNNLGFDETVAANDLMFSAYAAYNTSNIWVDMQPIYCLTARHGSLAHTISINICDAKLNVILRLNNFLLSINKYQYRANAFHYAWLFHYVSFSKMLYGFYLVFKSTPHFLVVWDFFYYMGHLMKTIFNKRSSLMKISK